VGWNIAAIPIKSIATSIIEDILFSISFLLLSLFISAIVMFGKSSFKDCGIIFYLISQYSKGEKMSPHKTTKA